jgi:hypothetical protein
MLLLVAGLLAPTTFRAAGAQAPDIPANAPTPFASSASNDNQSAPIVVPPQRDPFVPDAALASEASRQTTLDATTQQAQPMLLATMPLQSSPQQSPRPQTTQPRPDGIRGVIVGEHPYALVDVGGKTRLLAVGDTFQGRKITRIALSGVAFDDRSIARIPLLDQ